MASEANEPAEVAPAYKPSMKMRVSIIGALRNAAEELEAVSTERQEKVEADIVAAEAEQGVDRDHEDFEEPYSDIDYSGSFAYALTEIADNLEKLNAEPSLLFDFADLYALHGLAAAHVKPPATTPNS